MHGCRFQERELQLPENPAIVGLVDALLGVFDFLDNLLLVFWLTGFETLPQGSDVLFNSTPVFVWPACPEA